MKLIRADKDKFVFALGRKEKALLCELLSLYPLVPVAHHRISKRGGRASSRATGADGRDAVPPDENQRLLEEALAVQRQENKRQIRAVLNEPGRFTQTDAGFRLALSPQQMDWLLQVLNDVRVGSWLALGSPDTEEREQLAVNEDTAPHYFAMQAAGFFEMALVEAMSGQLSG